MTRKQQRRERKTKNRENYLLNRRKRRCGVMDDPTEEHVKALLIGLPPVAAEIVTRDLTSAVASFLCRVSRGAPRRG